MQLFGYLFKRSLSWQLLLFSLLAAAGCAQRKPVATPDAGLTRVRYAIQAGAFSSVERAAHFTRTLQNMGLDAYYFHDKSGLFKVRFGDWVSREEATAQAHALVDRDILKDYYIVSPEDYPATTDRASLRHYLVRTAEDFIGVPYQWGGSSADEGFDCSGLVMAVYRLNGLKLPRTSQAQYNVGAPVQKKELEKGDLVFFSGDMGDKISHVGVYAGRDTFIHAPGKGKMIRKDLLTDTYFDARYAGGRTYLR